MWVLQGSLDRDVLVNFLPTSFSWDRELPGKGLIGGQFSRFRRAQKLVKEMLA